MHQVIPLSSNFKDFIYRIEFDTRVQSKDFCELARAFFSYQLLSFVDNMGISP